MADYDSSPLMKSALEVLCHSIEHFVAGTARDHRLAVPHLAQAVELAAKAVLVERNEPIYNQRDETKTLSWRQCLEHLSRLWELDRIPFIARLELLSDERNALQHRFGTVDPLTIDYHMGTVFGFLQELMNREFGADLHAFLRDTLPETTWRRCRHVKDENQARIDRARSLVDQGDATSGLLEAFAALESATLAAAMRLAGQQPASTLDVLMKYGQRLAETGWLSRRDQPKLGELYRLRNAAVHANEDPPAQKVADAIGAAEVILRALSDPATEEALMGALTDSLAALRERGSATSGEAVSSEDLLDLIARRQLESPPPRFVGFARVARETGARDRLQSMVDTGLLCIYRVPNPETPDFPTAAVRLNTENPKIETITDPALLVQLRAIEYP